MTNRMLIIPLCVFRARTFACLYSASKYKVVRMDSIEIAAKEATRAIGVAHLRTEQRDAIIAFATGHNVFVSLPTGYEKSVSYGCLPGLFSSLRSSDGSLSRLIVVMVSPLISIMKDSNKRIRQSRIVFHLCNFFKSVLKKNWVFCKEGLVWYTSVLSCCCVVKNTEKC